MIWCVELYTKSNFQCDCVTNRMTNKCNVEPIKEVNTSLASTAAWG